jgi:hypothetical protein
VAVERLSRGNDALSVRNKPKDFNDAAVVEGRSAASERLVAATLDRLTHRCHILEAAGESYRLREALRRQSALPFPVVTALHFSIGIYMATLLAA